MRHVITLCALLLATPAAAQEVIGESIVEEKPVEILSDFTWRWKTPIQDGDCDILDRKLRFCGDAIGYRRYTKHGPEITAQYQFDDRNFGMFIIEDTGSEAGMTQDYMQTAVLENAATAAEIPAREIPVFDGGAHLIDGRETETVAYFVSLQGLSFIFYNTILIREEDTMQVITYSLGKGPTPEKEGKHATFLSEIAFLE